MTKLISLRKQKHIKYRPKKNKEEIVKKLNQLSKEKYKILFLLLSLIGILIGVICYRNFENNQISEIISENFNVLNSGKFKLVFLFLIKIDFIFFVISFFIGTSFLGAGISFIAPMIKCVYLGYFCGYLYNEFELKGVLFCLLLLYPCFTLTTTSLIFASNENMYMSQYIFKSLNGKLSIDNISVRLYILRYFLLISIDIICVLVSSLLISFLAPKFNII